MDLRRAAVCAAILVIGRSVGSQRARESTWAENERRPGVGAGPALGVFGDSAARVEPEGSDASGGVQAVFSAGASAFFSGFLK
jgi:hypothetical protein